MKITNKYGLPEPVYQAILKEGYVRGDADFTATELLKPPQQLYLQRKHNDEIEEDASNMLWAVMGSAIHKLMEDSGIQHGEREIRLQAEFDGVTVSGQFDYYDTRDLTLWDWKTVSVWEIIHGLKKDREEQLNILRVLLEVNGRTVAAIKVGCIIRDWSKSKASSDPGYPQSQFQEFTVPLWDHAVAVRFILDKIRERQGEPRECTDEDRWAKPDTWAVMSNGRKSAHRLLESEELAEQWMAENKKGDHIVHRPGESVRCQSYCSASAFCPQFQFIKGDGNDYTGA